MKIEIGEIYRFESAKPNPAEIVGRVIEKGLNTILIKTESDEKIGLLSACILRIEPVRFQDRQEDEVDGVDELDEEFVTDAC